VSEEALPLLFIAGGALTLITSPLIGRLADRHGKQRVFRIMAPISAAMTLVVTNLGTASTAVAVAVVAGLMVSNSGRMVPATALLTGSVAASRRGGFMSANSSVQHLTAGLAAFLAGLIIEESPDGALLHFPLVGWLSAFSTVISLWLVGRIRPAAEESPISSDQALAAAAEALCDATEPMV